MKYFLRIHFVTRLIFLVISFVKPSELYYNSLIVIYGQLRTFRYTCTNIFDNIVKPNSPSRVIIVIDGDNQVLNTINQDENIQNCLYPDSQLRNTSNYKIDTIVEIPKKKTALVHGVEFDLMNRALDYIEEKKFKANYILKIRTDNFINAAIDIGSAYGNSSSFTRRFMHFQLSFDDYMASYFNSSASFLSVSQNKLTLADRLWAWMLTAGISELIPAMLFYPSPSPWCFINTTTWNADMKQFIYKYHSNSLLDYRRGGDMWERDIRSAVLQIHRSFPNIVYLLGRTWVHFGEFQPIEKVSRWIVKDYGRLSWAPMVEESKQAVLPEGYKWPFDGAKLVEEKRRYDKFEWREVTESQLRLEHRKQGVRLIDMQNKYDELKSFSYSVDLSSLWDDIHDKKLVVYILRGCDKNPSRAFCNTTSRR